MADLLAMLPALFVPVLMIAFVIGMLFYRKAHLAKVQQDTADYQAGTSVVFMVFMGLGEHLGINGHLFALPFVILAWICPSARAPF